MRSTPKEIREQLDDVEYQLFKLLIKRQWLLHLEFAAGVSTGEPFIDFEQYSYSFDPHALATARVHLVKSCGHRVDDAGFRRSVESVLGALLLHEGAKLKWWNPSNGLDAVSLDNV